MTAAFDVLVIGAGVAGLSTARALQAQGVRVAVVDAMTPGGQGSRAAAGVCVPSVRLLDDLPMFDLARQARTVLLDELQALGAMHLRRAQGVIRPAVDEKTRAAMEEKGARAPGHLGRWANMEELGTLEPLLRGGQLIGAFVNDEGFMIDADAYLSTLLQDVAAHGATLRLGEPVTEVQEENDRVVVQTGVEKLSADRVAVCAGAWSGRLSGLPALPVRPQRGQLISVFHPSARLTRIVSGAAYIAPWRGGEIVIGATEEEAGFANHTTPAGVLFLSAYMSKLAPTLREARFVSHWSGLRAVSATGRLMIGPAPGLRRTFVGTAGGGQGIMTGALVGRILAEWMTTGRSERGEPFAPPAGAPAA